MRAYVGIYCRPATIGAILRYDNCFRYERRVAARKAGAPCLDPAGILFYGSARVTSGRIDGLSRSSVQIEAPITKTLDLSRTGRITGQGLLRQNRAR